MKQAALIASVFFFAGISSAQIKEGTIVYERKINLHRRITDEQMKAMVPEFRSSRHQLLFSDSLSAYLAVPEENTPDPFEGSNGGGRIMIRMDGAGNNGELFKNFSQARAVESRELGAKTYIIEDTIKQQAWKMTDESATILNYTCRKATRQNERGQIINVWYTEAIPCPAGPENFGSLPGVILKADVNNGEITFTALSMNNKVNGNDIKEPKKGKKISRSEFNKLLTDIMGNPGPGGRVIRMN